MRGGSNMPSTSDSRSRSPTSAPTRRRGCGGDTPARPTAVQHHEGEGERIQTSGGFSSITCRRTSGSTPRGWTSRSGNPATKTMNSAHILGVRLQLSPFSLWMYVFRIQLTETNSGDCTIQSPKFRFRATVCSMVGLETVMTEFRSEVLVNMVGRLQRQRRDRQRRVDRPARRRSTMFSYHIVGLSVTFGFDARTR